MPPLPDLTGGHKYLLDVSAIPDLVRLKDGLPPGFLVVSRFIDDLLQQASPEQGARVLQDMIRYDEDEAGGLTVISPTDFAAIAEAYQRFRARGVIDLIGEERLPEERSSVLERLLAVVVVTGLFVTGGFVLPVGVAGAVLYFVDP